MWQEEEGPLVEWKKKGRKTGLARAEIGRAMTSPIPMWVLNQRGGGRTQEEAGRSCGRGDRR